MFPLAFGMMIQRTGVTCYKRLRKPTGIPCGLRWGFHQFSLRAGLFASVRKALLDWSLAHNRESDGPVHREGGTWLGEVNCVAYLWM